MKKGKEGKKIHFGIISKKICDLVGHFATFLLALFFCLIWLLTGPVFHYSDTWQLVINTSTTIITFLIVFIIQNTQNRDTAILNIKLDEIIKSLRSADNHIINLEELSDKELLHLMSRYKKLEGKVTGQ